MTIVWYCNSQNQRIEVPEKVGYISELTKGRCYQSHSHAGWWYLCLWWLCTCLLLGCNQFDTANIPVLFFSQTDAQYKALESRHTLTSKLRGSRGWISVVVRQRRVNCASLGALPHSSPSTGDRFTLFLPCTLFASTDHGQKCVLIISVLKCACPCHKHVCVKD